MWGHNKTSVVGAKRNRWLVAGTMAAVAALGLTACAPSSNAPEIAALELHPTGPEGAWMRDGYVNGSTESFVTEGYLCSLRDGIAVESALGSTSVQARSVTTGEVLWKRDKTICVDLGTNGEYGLVVATGEDEGDQAQQMEVLDPATGKTQEILPLRYDAGTAAVAQVDDITVYAVNGGFVGIRDNAVAWQLSVKAPATPIALGDGIIGVSNIATGTITFVDGATGVAKFTAKPDAGRFEWATDGAAVLVDDDPSSPTSWDANKAKYTLIDVSGGNTGTIPAYPSPSLVPSFRDGVTITLADRAAAPTVFAVAQDGTPALFQDALGDLHTPTGPVTVDIKPGDLAGVSADGTVFLVDSPGNALTLITASGEVSKLGPVEKGSRIGVRDGYIVALNGSTTRVFLPNEE